jgi:hypothetical protein
VRAVVDRFLLAQKVAAAALREGNLVSLQEMYSQLLLEAPVAELHQWHQAHVLLRRELLVVAAAVVHVRKVVIPDKLFIRLPEVDVLQFVYKMQQMI